MILGSLQGPIAPMSLSTSIAPSTMLSRMTPPMPVGTFAAAASAAIASAPATKSLLPQPTGINPTTLATQSSYDYTATSLQPAKVAASFAPAPSSSIFGRTATGGGDASSSPASAPSSSQSSSWSNGPNANAMIANAPQSRAPDAVSASMMTTPGVSPTSTPDQGGGQLPSGASSGGATKASAPSGSAATPGGIPKIALIGGAVAILAIGALVVMRR